MRTHEITARQVRALLLLLVLVPCIPMVLMLRFISAARADEAEAARTRAVSAYRRTLASATGSLEKQLLQRATPLAAEEARVFHRALFDDAVEVGIADGEGRVLAGPAAPPGALIAATPLRAPGLAWEVRLYLVDDSGLRAEVHEQFKIYAWTAAVLGAAICAIAAAAGLTLRQQFQLHAMKNTSLATVAHELRTPLATARMLVDTLRAGRYRDAAQLREYLELIAAENERLGRLTDHFLTHLRLGEGRGDLLCERVGAGEVVASAVAALRAKLEAPGCQFTLEMREPAPELLADRDGLVTVLRNLLENALKYTGEEKRLALRVSAEDGEVVFAVSDNGLGLAESERRKIFEPFYQADARLARTREGCGLGLSIARRIVEAHRGRIEVASQPGAGSTFRVHLPLARAEPA